MISKEQRIRIVAWIRSGAPLTEGVLLYKSLPNNPDLLKSLRKDPQANAEKLYTDICQLMDISRSKFQSIINKYHGKEQQQKQLYGAGIKSQDRQGESKDFGGKTKSIDQSGKRSFRNEWPFLSRPECPAELKALASDKITAWENYTEAHIQLFDCSSIEECEQTAHKLIENFKENRLIHEELSHYKKHGAILGKHRIWKKYERFEKLRGLNVIELVRLHEKTLPHRIWRIESEIKKGDKPHLLGEREQRLAEVKAELAEVKRLLGINE